MGQSIKALAATWIHPQLWWEFSSEMTEWLRCQIKDTCTNKDYHKPGCVYRKLIIRFLMAHVGRRVPVETLKPNCCVLSFREFEGLSSNSAHLVADVSTFRLLGAVNH